MFPYLGKNENGHELWLLNQSSFLEGRKRVFIDLQKGYARMEVRFNSRSVKGIYMDELGRESL